jgi:DivIVA domain-containing protein
MSESDRRQRVISSTPRLATDEIANRSFAKGVRGFSETEVRAFLKRVAEEIAQARVHEQDLEAAIDSLEEQVRAPRPLSEQELLDALGEETARLLRSAREASDDIRKKAEERAARLVEEASESAEQTRADAAALLQARTAEAEAKTAQMISNAETRAMHALEAAKADAESILDQARQQGRVRRRSLLNGQIDALREGRDRLLDAYRTVKRTFLDATEALTQVEARAAVERTASVNEPIDEEAEVAAEIGKLDGGPPAEIGDAPDSRIAGGEVAAASGDATASDSVAAGGEHVEVVPLGSDAAEAEVATALADVDTLFARLRAGHDDAADVPVEAATDDGTQVLAAVAAEESAAAGETAPTGPRVSADDWRKRRAQAVDPLLPALLKRAKRRAQDDQNALLDSVRRHKGRPTSAQVLGEGTAARDAWAAVLREAIDRAYGAGRTAAGASAEAASDEVAGDAAESVISPLRERLSAAIDSGDHADSGGLVERIGARYREWKNQSLERTLSEVLAAAWTRGVYDAVPDEAVLWWVPFEEGRCSDCDDNALEPTVKGKQFPTGQAFPPAHPGCKCLLAPAGLLEGR